MPRRSLAEASKILSVSRNVGPNSQTRIFPLFTQDGLEFNPPVFLDVRKACAGKKVLIMGLPGAFTPC